VVAVDSSDPYIEKPVLVGSVAGNKCVAGLTILDSEMYVARSQSADVNVYSLTSSTLQPVRQLSVQRLRQPTDIAASHTATVLSISDAVGFVFVVDPAGTVYSQLQVQITRPIVM